MLRPLMEKVGIMWYQMDNVSREMATLWISPKEMLEIKNTVIEMRNVFDELISRLDRLRKESVSWKIGNRNFQN